MQGPFHVRFPLPLLLAAMAALAAMVALAGCVRLRPTPVPIPTVSYPGSEQMRTLVVLLPGRYDSPEDFGRYGFPEIAARAGVRADMVAVDAHLGYYYKRTLVDRLREDVIAPARKRYDKVLLAGISLGGTGSLLYAAEHPEDVDGIVLLAPFLGDDKVVEEVAAAGSLQGWKAPEPLAADDFQRRLWVWLQGATRPPAQIPIYLGWGKGDSFARANGLLARELPPDRVLTARGGHDWKAWTTLWTDFVNTGALGRNSG